MPCQFFPLYFTPGNSVIFLKAILPIVEFFTFCKPRVDGCVTSNSDLHPLHSCLLAIFKISLELTLFYCTQWNTIMDFDCICLSIHIMIKYGTLALTVWKFWPSRHYIFKDWFLPSNLRYSVPAFTAIPHHFHFFDQPLTSFSIRKRVLHILKKSQYLWYFFPLWFLLLHCLH